ncbi:MAG: hypothetical protein IKP64_04875, partial [Selenomonadaceae bacterium]|nr:hypothetical protein [Selenomonadaceae bacterium]
MKRPIKFRGRDKNGKFRYGDFNDIDLGTIFADVDEDSIAQLVGYDANGKEIYEGDKVTSEVYEGEYVARL